jgi:hypothetical protein
MSSDEEDLIPCKLSDGYAIASLDGIHWYEKPDDMTMGEFIESLPSAFAAGD